MEAVGLLGSGFGDGSAGSPGFWGDSEGAVGFVGGSGLTGVVVAGEAALVVVDGIGDGVVVGFVFEDVFFAGGVVDVLDIGVVDVVIDGGFGGDAGGVEVEEDGVSPFVFEDVSVVLGDVVDGDGAVGLADTSGLGESAGVGEVDGFVGDGIVAGGVPDDDDGVEIGEAVFGGDSWAWPPALVEVGEGAIDGFDGDDGALGAGGEFGDVVLEEASGLGLCALDFVFGHTGDDMVMASGVGEFVVCGGIDEDENFPGRGRGCGGGFGGAGVGESQESKESDERDSAKAGGHGGLLV